MPFRSACVTSCQNGDNFAVVRHAEENYILERKTLQKLTPFTGTSRIRQIVQIKSPDCLTADDPEQYLIAGDYVAVLVTSLDEELAFPTIQTIATFQRGCTCVAASEQYLAAGGDDFKIYVKNLENELVAEFEINCPVSSLAIEPLDEEHLVVIGSNGEIHIFNILEKSETKVITDLVQYLSKCNSHSDNETFYRRIEFQPTVAESVAVCGANGEVFFLNPMDDWDISDRFQVVEEGSENSAKLTCLSWNTCDENQVGKYIAFGDSKGMVHIFEKESNMLVKRERVSTGQVLDVSWLSDSDGAVYACGSNGEGKTIDLTSLMDKNEKIVEIAEIPETKESQKTQKPPKSQNSDKMDTNSQESSEPINTDIFDDDLGDFDDDAIKFSSGDEDEEPKKHHFEQSEAKENAMETDIIPETEQVVQALPNLDDDEEDIVRAAEKEGRDDEDLFASFADGDALVASKIENVDFENRSKKSKQSEIHYKTGPQVMNEPHESFQPGSTPSGKQEKYLCWNHVGKMRAIDGQSTDDKSIEIEFHDVKTHHAVHLTNLDDYKIGCLSKYGYCLASQLDDFDEDEYDDPVVLENLTKNSKAKLQVNLFKCSPHIPALFSKQWTYTMSRKTDIECVTMNDRFVAIGSSPDNCVHFWSLLGGCTFHRNLVIPGKIITLATDDDGDKILVVFEKTLGIGSTYNLGFQVYLRADDVFNLERTGHLPLESGDSLHWAGFSTDSVEPFIVAQESGRVMHLGQSGQITELCQMLTTRKKFDYYWITDIEELSGEIGCIMCKGNKFPVKGDPGFHNYLSIYEKSANMFCVENVGKDDLRIFQTQFSELVHLSSLVERGFDREPQMNKVLVKLFGSLIKLEGSDGRCFEVVNFCKNETMILKMARVAGKQGKYTLDSALQNLAEQVLQRKEAEIEAEQEAEYEQEINYQNNNRAEIQDIHEIQENDEIEEIQDNTPLGSPKQTVSQPFGQNFSPVVKKMQDVDLENDSEDADDRYEPMPEGDDDEDAFDTDAVPAVPSAALNPFARATKKQISTPKPVESGRDGPMKLQEECRKK